VSAGCNTSVVVLVRPVLYSFRRCPYAMRARLALAAAGLQPGRPLELREVALKAKPPELVAASAKATVPVLVLPDGGVIDQSLAIMRWALEQADPEGWLKGWSPAERDRSEALIAENDGLFKHHLDRYKYPNRYPGEPAEQHRLAAITILRRWSEPMGCGAWLLGDRPCLADWALLPFVRQFRMADPEAFEAEPGLERLQAWLARFLQGVELAVVMNPPWATRNAWCSPGWLYHLALRHEWNAACGEGVYCRSTRGRSLEEVGFIHLSAAHQVEATAQRFYGDLPAAEVLLLTIDPRRLSTAGLELREEPAPESGELFPHLYGPLPMDAVLLAQPLVA
jgi:glutathione S-transferase